MANMNKIYELQAQLRKIATSKKLKEVFIEFSDRSDKVGTYGTVHSHGNKMEFSRGNDMSTKCMAYNIMGFERVELNPADTALLEFLFYGGGKCTPAEFKKRCEDKKQLGYRDFSKASPALDIVVDFWHEQIVDSPVKNWEKAQAAVAAKVSTTPTPQQIMVGNTGRSL